MHFTSKTMYILTVYSCILLLSIGLLSWTISTFLDVINVDIDRNPEVNVRSGQPPFPGDQAQHLHWFMQISDLHLSNSKDPKRGPDLHRFCTEYLDSIKPEVVIVSGDLTDAQTPDFKNSRQYEEEWKNYARILKETGVEHKTVWLDIRGNHDTFNVPSLESKRNLHRIYSLRGKTHQKSFLYTHAVKDARFSFIAVDACLYPGLKRPFNFFGLVKQEVMNELYQFRKESHGSNMTFWFGHYPTSVILSPDPGVRSIMSRDGVYMCGHLHTLLDYVPRMHTMHKAGNLELEVGDWKINRIFRVFAVDHDIFSFTDEKLGNWPIVLVTNPKHALYNMPYHEPTGRAKRSTHIRILAFSEATIDLVKVAIDDIMMGNARHVKGPLFVLPWKPEDFASRVHTLNVVVKDAAGRERTIQQPFSLDNTKLKFDQLPRIVLMVNHSAVLKLVYMVITLAILVPLVIYRFIVTKPHAYIRSQSLVHSLLHHIAIRLHLLANSDVIFYSISLFTIYVSIGPWYIGQIIDGYIGVMFIHGIYINDSYIPGDLTYFYGILQMVTFNIPLTIYLGNLLWSQSLSIKKEYPHNSSNGIGRIWQYFKLHWLFIIVILWQSSCAYHGFFKAYGTIAFIIGPVRTWSIGLAFYLRSKAISQTLSTENCNGCSKTTEKLYS